MIIPIRTDYRMTCRPWVNYALVAANVLVFLYSENVGGEAIRSYLLYPEAPQVYQFFTSAFLHANFMHVAGNMVFLWVFGNALNDRFGHAAYLAFYLAGGVVAGVGYVLLAGRAPVLVASGAICAVTGAYLVLFPRVRVTVLIWIFYFITRHQISSLIFVGLQFLYDVLMTVGQGGGGVAYAAHTSGYVFGMSIALILLALKVLPRDPMDLPSMVSQSHRRQRYRRMVSQGYNPFVGTGPSRPEPAAPPTSRWVDTRTAHATPPDSEVAQELALRREVSEACARHDLPAAAGKYLQLVQIADGAVLSRQNQLDVANQLMASEQYPAAADAYERFLKHYGGYEHAADIYLMLGLLYGRYLHQYDRAEHYLQRALEGMGDTRKTEMARAELQQVRHRRGG